VRLEAPVEGDALTASDFHVRQVILVQVINSADARRMISSLSVALTYRWRPKRRHHRR
jgi:hypothetical protein